MLIKILATIAVVLFFIIAFVSIARGRSSTVYAERTVSAPAERVWKLWNDPESIQKWWGPKDYTAPVIKNDLRVGGTYLLSMRSQKGEIVWNAGSYKEVVPNTKIVSTMSFSDANGKAIPGSEVRVPGKWPDEITVTVEFKGADGKTTIAITEVGIPLIMKFFGALGWQQQLDKFEALL
ncbi:MAG: SRPBCC domain-containing protein [Methylococcus sp.]|nr:SRPBCC domain-containing protein [Methylococcus sp.]